ncbi:unnamed protein product [Ectocarpus sp. 6 AP-2014]
MEFHDVGVHCAAEMCGQQGATSCITIILPFTCDACGKVFCLDHRTHAGHNCTNANAKDKRVLECSKCNKVLQRPAGVEHALLLERHLASGCVDGVRKARPNKIRCSVQGCRRSEFVKVSCGSCRRNFCFKHRHEDDHKCEAITEATKREHPRLQKRGLGGTGGPKPKPSDSRPSGGKEAAEGRRPCGVAAAEAAARRERGAAARRGAGTGSGIAAR